MSRKKKELTELEKHDQQHKSAMTTFVVLMAFVVLCGIGAVIFIILDGLGMLPLGG